MNFVKLLDFISKEQIPEKIVNKIDETSFGEIVDNLDDEKRILTKVMICNTKALCDKGMKAHAHMLSQEYMAQEDLDGDNLIYGVDWVYENPPPVLKHIKPHKDAEIRTFEYRR